MTREELIKEMINESKEMNNIQSDEEWHKWVEIQLKYTF